jgi:hypothetical protein
MNMTKRTTPVVGALMAALVLLLPAGADAKKLNVRVGIGDQSPAIFSHPEFQKAKIKRVRYFIRWNAVHLDYEMQRAHAYLAAAKAAGASVLFHISSDNLTRRAAKLPSKKVYRRDVTALVKHFRALGVREWGSRNEANHDSQATWRSPARAAWEFKVVKKACKRCTVIGLDLLDQRGTARYIKRYFRALGSRTWRRRVSIVGIHNYADVNRKRMTGTREIIRTVRRYNRRAKFWFTETGGLVRLSTSWPHSPSRAAKRLGYLFKIMKRYRRDVTRVYIFCWTGSPRDARFDAGLTNPDGSARPALRVFKKNIRKFRR